jgi:hypothetical protein
MKAGRSTILWLVCLLSLILVVQSLEVGSLLEPTNTDLGLPPGLRVSVYPMSEHNRRHEKLNDRKVPHLRRMNGSLNEARYKRR